MVQFELVADPMYHTAHPDWEALTDIEINPARRLEDMDFPITPYEIGCQITAADIPSGAVRFSLSGRHWEALKAGRIEEAIVDESVPIILNCFRVDRKGMPRRDPEDKRFLLRIVPDPASRLPIISQEEDFKRWTIPFWCSACSQEITGPAAAACQTVDCRFNLCWRCSDLRTRHPADHRLADVNVKYL